MTHLGIHDGHNASAAVVRDGLLAMAVQEERFTRIKNQGDVPEQAIAHYDGSIDSIALNGTYMNYGQWRRAAILADYRATPTRRWRDVVKGTALDRAYQLRKARARERAIAELPVLAPLAAIEHHTAHAATAYYTSPWRDGTALVMTCDGSGDRLSASVSLGRNGRLERIAAVSESDSIGRLYSLVTFALGLTPLEHEYKVMGLALYGRNSSLFAGAFEFPSPLTWKRGVTDSAILTRCRNRRFDDLAASAQREVELLLPVWIRNAIYETGIRNVACAGGVFMNVKANLAVLQIPELEQLYIAPSCGDESNSIGAAIMAAAQAGEAIGPMPAPYLGPDITNEEADQALQGHRLRVRYCRNIDDLRSEEHTSELQSH